jgi:hypothetical protein
MMATKQTGILIPRTAVPAPEWEVAGNEWNADVHYTPMITDERQISALNAATIEAGDAIVAYFLYEIFQGTGALSLEFQFKSKDARNRYMDAFDANYSTKKKRKKR